MTTETLQQKRPTASIVVHKRQRSMQDMDQGALKDLMESIKRTKGLLHPVVVDPADQSLVAGGRRLTAYLLLQLEDPEGGWDEIPFTYKGQESAIFRKVCELEENLARLDLEWWERAAAIAEIDDLQRQIAADSGESWTLRKTAEITGLSLGTIQQNLEIVKEAAANPKIREEKTLTGALSQVKTKKQIAARQAEIERKSEGRTKTFPAEILVGDALDLIRKEPAEEFDAVVTNFPFGVEYGYSGKNDKLYEDEEAMIVDLVRSVVFEAHRVLKNDSWMFAFFDIRKATYSNPARAFVENAVQRLSAAGVMGVKDAAAKALGLAYWFEEAGFSYVNLMPIIWAKPNKTAGNIGDPRKGLVVAYEAAIIAAKGDAVLLKQGKQDLLIYDTLTPSERDFEMQMPRELCGEILSWLVLGGARVLDPFAGVGSFGEGALDRQCSFRGFELNAERAATGNLRLQEHIFAKEKTSGELT